MRETQGSISPDQLKEMPAQARIEFLRGAVPDFSNRINHVIDSKLGQVDPAVREKVLTAFQGRVEDHLMTPGGVFGGAALDHLPQLGRQLITQELYEDLNATAAALAAEVMSAGGFQDYARPAYEALGRMVAKKQLGV